MATNRKEAPAEPEHEVRRHLTVREYLRVLAAAEQSSLRDACLIRVLYECGLRRSEVGVLKLSYCDQLKARKLYVWRYKASLSGYVSISTETAKKLEAWVRYYKEQWWGQKLINELSTAAPLFPGNSYDGLCGRAVYKRFDKLARQARIPLHLQHPHVLKHSRVQHLLDAGARLNVSPWELFEAIAQLVGHATARTTLQYYVSKASGISTFAQQVTEALSVPREPRPPRPRQPRQPRPRQPRRPHEPRAKPTGRPKGAKDKKPRKRPRKSEHGEAEGPGGAAPSGE